MIIAEKRRTRTRCLSFLIIIKGIATISIYRLKGVVAMDPEESQERLISHKGEVVKRFGIKEIGVFGSHVKKVQKAGSDIDILVGFLPGLKTFDSYMELKFFLEDTMGARIDLVIKEAPREELKKYILPEVIYV
jgi:hypothetical protein